MLTIRIIALGKLKEPYLTQGCEEYKKRLGAYCKLEIIELSPERLSDNPSEKEIATALETEAEKILQKAKGVLIPLCIEGKQISSEGLAEAIEGIANSGSSEINFIIGSSFGLAPRIKEMGRLRLSMSKMTFPHQLARLMLLEQIYRAMNITSGGKYHK